ncbi:gamma-glutamylcyclotransferase family protein [Alkalilacustris brevis]|uniref:gamma-glutamylcyclotransferase family protein n=1 Tax=Alkalilacustris brevis TaxID=2026338 RepID=UPI000E0E040C|nr:gamma-glutamylcyclotransferase family protein [Alkalilacustris brevis]
MQDHFFFGYGSLVNRATHDYAEAYHARVAGWRRVWRHTRLRPLAFLSVEPAPEAEIEGLIAGVPGGDWQALDQREQGYRRHPLDRGLAHAATRPVQAQIYAVPGDDEGLRHPILLSYLDVVLQGYLQEFGEPGALRFFATTGGWAATPILDDRADPLYPRHQKLSASERGFVDERIAAMGLRVIRR